MKKLMMLFAAVMIALSFATVSIAGGGHKIMGTVEKVDGDMVDVKDDKGKVHKIHVDKKATKTTGEIKAGSKVEAQTDEKGHATSVTVK